MQFTSLILYETFFDSLVTVGDKNIQLNGYNLISADHSSNKKRGGVCISSLLTH